MREIEMRCTCTMLEIEEGHFVKPDDGYLPPNPDCRKCGGRGSKLAKFDFGDTAEATWIGICPVCSTGNGIYFQYPGMPTPDEDGNHRPGCLDDACPNEHCTWVREDDIEK